MNFENLGSLITIEGTDQCLGDLIHFEGRGTYDAHYGRVDVSKSDAELHNKALDTARLAGLDDNCKVGQGSYAYYGPKSHEVRTFVGTLISDGPTTVRGSTITFTRKGKTFRGRLTKDNCAFNYTRTK